MSFHFLATPLKSTAEVDLVKPLNSYIQSVYNTSEDDKSEIAEAVQVRIKRKIWILESRDQSDLLKMWKRKKTKTDGFNRGWRKNSKKKQKMNLRNWTNCGRRRVASHWTSLSRDWTFCSGWVEHSCSKRIVLFSRYFDQLVSIENKVIISATQNPVVFKWKDAFDKGSLFSSRVCFFLF